MAVKKRRFEALQTLRFMCFLIVFGDHSGFYKVFPIPNYGELCIMSVFLMMSGFLMVYSYNDREVPSNVGGCFRFSTGKIKKLYPLHVETAVIQLIIILILYRELIAIDFQHVLRLGFRFVVNLGLMQAWVPDFPNYVFSFNGPSWFLSVMLFAYFMFPLFLRLLKKLGDTKKVLILALAVVIVSFVLESVVGRVFGVDSETNDVYTWFTQNSPIMRTVDFFLGCVMGYIYVGNRKTGDPDSKSRSLGLWTVIELAVILLFYLGSYYLAAQLILKYGTAGKMVVFCQPLFSALFAIPMILIFVWERGYITKLLSWKPLVYLGNISMYTYLIHYVFTQAWASLCLGMNIDNSGMTRVISIVVEFALTIICSIWYDRMRTKKAAKKKVAK